MTFQLNTSSGPQVAEAFPAAQGARQEPTLDRMPLHRRAAHTHAQAGAM